MKGKMKAAVCAAALALLCGAAEPSAAQNAEAGEEKLKIAATIFPEYDWVMNLLGERAEDAEVTLLLDSGVDLHSFQPGAEEVHRISSCDLFLYVGGESDRWVGDALKEAVNPDMIVINLLETLGKNAKEEELAEGMETEKEEADGTEEDASKTDLSYDEHVWLSLKNAEVFCGAIENALETLDPDHASEYRENADAYIGRLEELDEAYQDAVENASVHTLVFADRFPFRYLTDDYGLSYYAAFAGCSAETEASFDTIIFLAGKIDEYDLDSVMTIEGSDGRIAQTVVQTTKKHDQKILALDSMQSTTGKDMQNGANYLDIMQGNLEVLREALG